LSGETTGTANRFGIAADALGAAMLTKKQNELLRFIHERLKESGVPPSFDEMKDALDLRSKSGIHRLIMALEERGFIRRLPNRARALEVLRLPEASTPSPSRAPAASRPASSRAISAVCARASAGGRRRRGCRPMPCRSRSWGASPPARRSRRSRRAATPSPCRRIFSARASIIALEVRGDSMIDAGIFDGDTVIIRNVRTPPSREISSWPDRRRGGDAEALRRAAPRSRSRPPTRPMRRAFSDPTACASRASWSSLIRR
jgi:repressor LexA